MSHAASTVQTPLRRVGLRLQWQLLGLATGLICSGSAWAGKAHVHGVVSLQLATQGQQLTVQLEAPLDSLVGFEHRPRTAAQRDAAQAALKTLGDPAQWLTLPASAQCQLSSSEIDAESLQPAKPGTQDAAHADLFATLNYQCASIEALRALELPLFKRFPRIKRIEVQWVTDQGQGKQTLRAPNGSLRIGQR